MLTGETVRFVSHSDVMNRWFDVCAFRVGGQESQTFAILFTEERQLCCYAAMLKGRKIFDLPSATGFKAPKFIYEKTKKYVFLNAPQEILRPY